MTFELADYHLNPDYLSVAQVCVVTGCAERTVRGWIHDGELAAVKFGPRRLRVPIQEVEALIERKAAQS